MKTLTSINPFNNSIIEQYREDDPQEIQEKLKCSLDAFSRFRDADFSVKSANLLKVADMLRDRTMEYAKTITLEMGKPIRESRAEVLKCAWVCEFYAEKAEEFLSPRFVRTDADNSYVIFQPIGPVLAIMPWNFPYWQVFRFAAPALMAGNTALLKHASNMQGCAHQIEELFLQAGFEKGVFQNLCISSGRVHEVIEDPVVKAVTLTGSESAGSAVAALSGKNIKKSVLELGGNNSFIILEDADLELAVELAIPARLQNGGQSCIAAKRFIIEKEVYEVFTQMLLEKLQLLKIGNPLEDDTDIGPLYSIAQAEAVDAQVRESVKSGAKLIYGGKRNDSFYEPTLLLDVKPGMPVFDEEVFGPVFAFSAADSSYHALELSNQSSFGLGASVFTRSQEKAEYFIQKAEEGAVFVNALVKSDPRLPFGGVKKSGYGRELSSEGIREFMNVKTIYIEGI